MTPTTTPTAAGDLEQRGRALAADLRSWALHGGLPAALKDAALVDKLVTALSAAEQRENQLRRERDEARAVVAACNNSLFGSKSYFVSEQAAAIENLKEYGRRQWAIADAAEQREARAVEALINLNRALDAMWNDGSQVGHRPGAFHVTAISAAQAACRKVLRAASASRVTGGGEQKQEVMASSAETAAAPQEVCPARAEINWNAAVWRRGMMHAVERLDLILTPGRKIPKVRYGETIEAARRALDEITEFQRHADPTTYREAFDICTANYNEARAALADGARSGASTTEADEGSGTTKTPNPASTEEPGKG